MTIFIITLFILLATLLIVVELLLLPGVTVAGFGAVVSFIVSIMMTYYNYGFDMAILTIIISLAISITTLIICTRKKSLNKISLNEKIEGKAIDSTNLDIAIGSTLITTTRLAPMGNITTNGKTYQAKSISGYIEPKSEVVVVAHEDSIIIVKSQS